ncbi:hypothetical protein DASC09_045890 [Saccharomycopsis crataegensis]|uniref:Pre-mRNA-splicing factor SYF2 n=1 Tax=Saccharomycopsis crataegensis TaxID=43959 RepID=A0AAV5QRA3_9ASCO|nr:hypothetical protein DASC09_045890 [Saccharomycopsis crataegensis]
MSSTTKDKLSKFKQLQKQRSLAQSQNKSDVYREHSRNSTTPAALQKHSQKQQDAELALLKMDDPLTNQQMERKKLWNYSVEDNQKWHEKNSSVEQRSKNQNDQNILAERTYLKKINEISKKKLSLGIKDASVDSNDGEYQFDHQPSKQTIELYTGSLQSSQNAKITKTNKNKLKNGKDTTLYINRKNKEFNEKLARHYDKHIE